MTAKVKNFSEPLVYPVDSDLELRVTALSSSNPTQLIATVQVLRSGQLKYGASRLLAEERNPVAHSRQRHIYLSVKLGVITWLGLVAGGIVLVAWVVHTSEKPVTWLRSLAIGVIWAVLAVPAVLLGVGINRFVYYVAVDVLGTRSDAGETAYIGALLAYCGGFAAQALVGGMLTFWVLRPVRATSQRAEQAPSADLNGHAPRQSELGPEPEQPVPQLAGNRAHR